ncbi:hypothetical protein BDD12DRAFT_114431 [Trichophaea hybrida]|nr:hypothetical protein BDD12DRAFT_114431 [Trichophaea hybrida]
MYLTAQRRVARLRPRRLPTTISPVTLTSTLSLSSLSTCLNASLAAAFIVSNSPRSDRVTSIVSHVVLSSSLSAGESNLRFFSLIFTFFCFVFAGLRVMIVVLSQAPSIKWWVEWFTPSQPSAGDTPLLIDKTRPWPSRRFTTASVSSSPLAQGPPLTIVIL